MKHGEHDDYIDALIAALTIPGSFAAPSILHGILALKGPMTTSKPLKATNKAPDKYELMRNTLYAVVKRWPDVCSREVREAKGPVYRRSATEDINHILHTSNFRRSKFGYSQHHNYQAELDRATNNWTQDLHDELIDHLENPDPTPEQLEAREKAAEIAKANLITHAELLRAEKEARVAERLRKRAELYSDAPDDLPSTLLDELSGVAGDAVSGSW